MYKVNQIADYVIFKIVSEDDNSFLSNLKLQKLLYFIQAWSFGKNSNPMFSGGFQAWIHGPVNVEIYNRFKDRKSMYSPITMADIQDETVCGKIKKEDAEFIDYILDNYAGYSGSELEQMSHMSEPWLTARGRKSPYERCATIITDESLIKYYGEKWAKLND